MGGSQIQASAPVIPKREVRLSDGAPRFADNENVARELTGHLPTMRSFGSNSSSGGSLATRSGCRGSLRFPPCRCCHWRPGSGTLPAPRLCPVAGSLPAGRKQTNPVLSIRQAHLEMLIHVARQGLGIACVPEFAVREALDAGELVSILPDQVQRTLNIQVVWPSSRHLTPKLRAFIYFICDGGVRE